ncbi:MAG: hypothetical protein Q7K57_26995 [Burkholderiaceae bacterium]|nr:hypothetical protein [Burkholderiaceae bacterium]
MNRIAVCRTKVYDYFQAHASCQNFFNNAVHKEEYVAYYNSMYLLQDATDSLGQHRKKGFSKDPLEAYLEFWGLMQALIIQQDCIAEVFEVLTGSKLDSKALGLTSWTELRTLRNICAGHPVKKNRPKSSPTRSFMGRSFGNYDSFTYECWEKGGARTHPQVKLGVLLDSYAGEAESQLNLALCAMQARWP